MLSGARGGARGAGIRQHQDAGIRQLKVLDDEIAPDAAEHDHARGVVEHPLDLRPLERTDAAIIVLEHRAMQMDDRRMAEARGEPGQEQLAQGAALRGEVGMAKAAPAGQPDPDQHQRRGGAIERREQDMPLAAGGEKLHVEIGDGGTATAPDLIHQAVDAAHASRTQRREDKNGAARAHTGALCRAALPRAKPCVTALMKDGALPLARR